MIGYLLVLFVWSVLGTVVGSLLTVLIIAALFEYAETKARKSRRGKS